MMGDQDIGTLIEVLRFKKKAQIAKLLVGSKSDIEESSTYGSRYNSVLSTFVIYAPMKNFYALKKLTQSDRDLLLTLIQDIYPLRDNSPEVASIEYRMLPSDKSPKPEAKALEPQFVAKSIRVFISYSHKDRVLASKIKASMELYGMEVFLAHEDINPSSEWQDVILENLKSTDVFLPIITDDFKQSEWTDQESGIALSERKLIIPLAVSRKMPYGFIGKFQALKIDPELLSFSDPGIITAIVKRQPLFSSRLFDSLVASFANSTSWDSAGRRAGLLMEFEEIDKRQISEIFRAATSNDQIYGSFTASPKLKQLYEKYKDRIGDSLLEKIKLRFPYWFETAEPAEIDLDDIPF